MDILSIEQWKALAAISPGEWRRLLVSNLESCIDKTNTSVVSADFSNRAAIGDGPFGGVPYVLKDLYDYRGAPTHSSSVLPFLTAIPAEKDSELVTRLKAMGASCVAKTQMNEFAYGLSGENPHYGDCPHPLLSSCLSGGSSSGSAYMVAAGYVPLGFGTDTGGSIRLPASWCGIYGIRWVPEYLMEGGFPLAPSFDTMGWFTKSGEDMEEMLKAWFVGSDARPIDNLKGGVFLPEALLEAETFVALKEAAKGWGLREGQDLSQIESMLPSCQKAFNVLQSREAYIVHQDWLSKHSLLYDPAVKHRIERAREWSDTDVSSALEIWDEVCKWFESYFESNDYLAMPVCPGPSIPLGEATAELRENTLRLTTPASLAQKPALTIPVWLDERRSVGMQFIFKDTSPEVPLGVLKQCKNS